MALTALLAASATTAHPISARASVGMTTALRRLASAEADAQAGEAALAMAEADGKPIVRGEVAGEAAIFLGGEADTAAGEAEVYVGQAAGAAVYKVAFAGEAGEA